jgi:hypothetical protein
MQSYPTPTTFVPYTPIIPTYPYTSVLDYSTSTLQNSFSPSSPPITSFSLKSEDRGLDEEIMKFKLERLSLLEKLRELETMYNSEEEDGDFRENEILVPGLNMEEEGKKNSIEEDEEFARRILLEEKKMITEGAKNQKKIAQEEFESGMDKILHDGELSQDLSQLEKDARFAAQLEEIFHAQQQNQIDEDEKLARYLADQEGYNTRNTVATPAGTRTPKVPPVKKIPFPRIPVNNIITMNKTTPQMRSHAVLVHNANCACRKTDAGNNGHLFKIHDLHCKCCKLHMKS